MMEDENALLKKGVTDHEDFAYLPYMVMSADSGRWIYGWKR